jgi:hypothetical protein
VPRPQGGMDKQAALVSSTVEPSRACWRIEEPTWVTVDWRIDKLTTWKLTEVVREGRLSPLLLLLHHPPLEPTRAEASEKKVDAKWAAGGSLEMPAETRGGGGGWWIKR